MQFRSAAKTGLAFIVGSTGIPAATTSFVPIEFLKGQLPISYWEGIFVLAVALMVTSSVSAALFLACLKLDRVVPAIWNAICIGLLATVLAIAIHFQTGNLLSFFLFHFGFAVSAGLLLQRTRRGLV